MNTNPAVIFDACVFYPAPLLYLLVELAGQAQDMSLFRAKWTEAIHEEWINSLLGKKPQYTKENLTRTRNLMDSFVDDCLVTGHEHRIEGLTLSDPGDRHVLAAFEHADLKAAVSIAQKKTQWPGAACAAPGDDLTRRHAGLANSQITDISSR